MSYKELYTETKLKYLNFANAKEMLIDFSDLETTFKLYHDEEIEHDDYDDVLQIFLEEYFTFLPSSNLKLLDLSSKSVKEIQLGKTNYKKIGQGNNNVVYTVQSAEVQSAEVQSAEVQSAEVQSAESVVSTAKNVETYVHRLCINDNYIDCIKDNVFMNFLYALWENSMAVELPNPFNSIDEFYYFNYEEQRTIIPIFKTSRKEATISEYLKTIFLLTDKNETQRLLYKLFDTIIDYITRLYKLCKFIHGDLKPDNLMCEYENSYLKRLYIIDLGCSQFEYNNSLYTTDFYYEEKYKNTYNEYKDIQFFMFYIYTYCFEEDDLQDLLCSFVQEYVENKKIMKLENYSIESSIDKTIYTIMFNKYE